MTRRNQDRGAFGSVAQLPSGRWQAKYFGPDGSKGRRYTGPTTFGTKREARKFLSTVEADIIRGKWLPPEDSAAVAPGAKTLTLKTYANTWLEQRDLKTRTAEHYRKILDNSIIDKPIGGMPLRSITADDVRAWYAKLDKKAPTLRAHTYGLLRTIMGTAVTDGKIPTNPCTIRGAGSVERAVTIRPASLDELAKLVDAIEPARYKAMILLAAWTALRFGELTELQRKDIDLDDAVIRVRRGVVRTESGFETGAPKSVAGSRDVAIPPHLIPALKDHLVEYTEPGGEALLFPAEGGGHLAPSTLYRRFYKAREAAGRPDLRFHDLRHTGAVLAAQTGATLAELMSRLGHSTPAAALRYQHTAENADKRIAAALSKLVTDTP
ncbi:tyrosine-type recombinase/integrase [Mycobacterium sp. SA01]|uniref:tyrosine-type recombinase/integrase n=1 Tax=Mycobacterium sp. SA01 TaxID=3238820 RepID=UPI00351B7C7C